MISGQTAVLGPNGQVLQPGQELDTNDATESCNNEAITDVSANELKCCICMLSLFLLISASMFACIYEDYNCILIFMIFYNCQVMHHSQRKKH